MGVDLFEEGDLSDSSPDWEDLEPPLLGYRSGALYDSIFVVERSSTGAEIFICLREDPKECLVVTFLLSAASSILALRLVVKALDRDILLNRSGVDDKRNLFCPPTRLPMWVEKGGVNRIRWPRADVARVVSEFCCCTPHLLFSIVWMVD